MKQLRILLFLFFYQTAFAQLSPGDLEQATLPAMEDFERAVQGDENAVQPALEKMHVLQHRFPNNPVVQARIGSLTSMKARDAWAPWTKMRYAEQGMDLLDKALNSLNSEHDTQTFNQVPVSLSVKFTAASTFMSMPKFLNRWGHAKRLFRDITENATFTQTPKSFQAQVWLNRGRLAEQQDRADESREWLQRVIAIDPDGAAAVQAQSLLGQENPS